MSLGTAKHGQLVSTTSRLQKLPRQIACPPSACRKGSGCGCIYRYPCWCANIQSTPSPPRDQVDKDSRDAIGVHVAATMHRLPSPSPTTLGQKPPATVLLPLPCQPDKPLQQTGTRCPSASTEAFPSPSRPPLCTPKTGEDTHVVPSGYT